MPFGRKERVTMLEGIFERRRNRFVAEVWLHGALVVCHVKNTGRCKELLFPGAKVWLELSEKEGRKTAYDLILVEKEGRLINIDSSAPNRTAREYLKQLFPQAKTIRAEVPYRESRLDFYVEDGDRRIFVEVKGVTLEEGGVARFPDAPTERGIKHLKTLEAAVAEGYEGMVLFVIQMKGVRYFTPNDQTHPAFGSALRHAFSAGVKILAVDCIVTEEDQIADAEVKVVL